MTVDDRLAVESGGWIRTWWAPFVWVAGFVAIAVATVALFVSGLEGLFTGGLTLVWTAFCAWYIARHLVDRSHGGGVLADGGRRPAGLAMAICGAVMLLAGVASLLLDLGTNRPERLMRHLFYLPWGAWNVMWGLSRVQMLEAGVWSDSRLLRWQRIQSFATDERAPDRLHLTVVGWRDRPSRTPITVALDQRPRFVELLLANGVPEAAPAAAVRGDLAR